MRGVEDKDIHAYFMRGTFPDETTVDQILEAFKKADRPLSLTAIESAVNLRRGAIESTLKQLNVEGIVDRTLGELLRRAGEVSVTWCPTTGRRRRRRGYDSGELIARALARRLGARPVRLLRRLDRLPQTGAGRGARRPRAPAPAGPPRRPHWAT